MRNLTTFVFLFLTMSAYSATQATLILKGFISENMSIEVENDTQAQNLNLMASQVDLIVGNLKYSSNSATGFKIVVASENNFQLESNDSSHIIPYSMKIGTTQATQNGIVVNNSSQVIDALSDIKVSYTAQEGNAPAGEYKDTLTFTISAN